MSLTSLTVHRKRALMIDSHVDSMWSCLFWYVINALSGLTSVTFFFWMFKDLWEHVSDLTAILLYWALWQGLGDPCRADREHKSGKPPFSVSGELDFQTHKCTFSNASVFFCFVLFFFALLSTACHRRIEIVEIKVGDDYSGPVPSRSSCLVNMFYIT